MAKKVGNGGHSLEEYDPNTGKYVSGGSSGESRPAPRKQMENPFLYDYYDQEGMYNTEEALENYNMAALDMIMEETGMGYADAYYFQDCLMQYLGGDFANFTGGHEQKKTQVIDEGLSKMGAFDGDISRGMSFKLVGNETPEKDAEQLEKFNKFMSLMKPGSIYSPNVLQSWTDVKEIARSYADVEEPGHASIICHVRQGKNKSAVGVKHISKFGDLESEVLAPSTVKYRVVSVFSIPKGKYGNMPNRIYQIILEEI